MCVEYVCSTVRRYVDVPGCGKLMEGVLFVCDYTSKTEVNQWIYYIGQSELRVFAKPWGKSQCVSLFTVLRHVSLTGDGVRRPGSCKNPCILKVKDKS